MKRQLIIASIALSTVGLAACGSKENQAKDAGEQVGEAIASLQTTVMARPASYRLEGVQSRIEDLKNDLPEDTVKQLEAVKARFQTKVTQAENHPEELSAAAQDALQQLDAVSGDSKELAAFKQGVQDGYKEASQ